MCSIIFAERYKTLFITRRKGVIGFALLVKHDCKLKHSPHTLGGEISYSLSKVRMRPTGITTQTVSNTCLSDIY